MDGLYEIVTTSVPIEIGDRDWQISPLLLADYAEMERWLVQKRRSSLDAIQEHPEERQRQILGLAFDEAGRADRATGEELHAWLRTAEGVLFEFWLRLRAMQPWMTLANVERLFADRVADVSTRMAKAARTTGEYPLGRAPSCERNATSGRDKPVPWRSIFRQLIRAGIWPETVGSLTPAQLQIILLKPADMRQTVQLTPAAAEEFRSRRARQRNRWIEERMAEFRRDDEQAPQERLHQGLEVLASLGDRLSSDRPNRARRTFPAMQNRADGDSETENCRRALRDAVARLDDLLAKNHRPNSIVHPDSAPRFSDGP